MKRQISEKLKLKIEIIEDIDFKSILQFLKCNTKCKKQGLLCPNCVEGVMGAHIEKKLV